MKAHLNLTVTQEVRKLMQDQADKLGVSISQLVALLVKQNGLEMERNERRVFDKLFH